MATKRTTPPPPSKKQPDDPPTDVTLTLDPPPPPPRSLPMDYGGALPPSQAEVSAFSEVGGTGLRRHGGYVYEEILRELAGYKSIRVYKDMSENEPVIGALLFAIEMLVRSVEWDVKPAGPDTADLLAAKRVKECMDDMSSSWLDVIVEILSMLPYGWSWHEVVYKVRNGETSDPDEANSRFDDGLIGWRKIPIRSQDSLLRWDFDSAGGVRAMFQLPPPDYIMRRIPIEKSLLFRTKSHKNNPQGASILRNAYVPWYFKKNIQRIEAIGIERDLAGLPTLGVPPRLLAPSSSAEEKALLHQYQQMITNVRRDEAEGIIYPLAYDTSGKELYRLSLLSTGGTRQFNTTEVLQRYNQEIAVTVLADFILIGHGSQGSGGGKGGTALVDNKTRIFSDALTAWMDVIAGVFNRVEVPRLFRLNGWPIDKLPEITHGKVEQVDLADLGAYVASLAGSGMPLFPDDALENILRTRASLPEKPEHEEGQDTPQPMPLQAVAPPPPPPTAGPPEVGAPKAGAPANGAAAKKPNGAAGPPAVPKPPAAAANAARSNGKPANAKPGA
jgi:hypothetical protein